MDKGKLSAYFKGIGAKRLSAVEASPERSNQHEFNGVSSMKHILGTERRGQMPARFLYLGESEDDFRSDDGTVSWYDARENHPTRTEWRLYYPTTSVSTLMTEGDLAIFAQQTTGEMMVLVAARGSTFERQLIWLFELEYSLDRMQVSRTDADGDRELNYAANLILDELGIELRETDEDFLETMLTTFGPTFPSTRDFSAFAQQSVSGVDARENPDEAILLWLEQEELLFRTLERYFVKEQLDQGFRDVDHFIRYSLSVQNRRKSRAGYAFENHLETVFRLHDVAYDREAKTENRSRPDFLFPGHEMYHNDGFPTPHLTMMGVKSTCKDRWRQVLAEAARIERKHLITLEPGISENQTDEMKDSSLQLVLPSDLQNTYSQAQRSWLMSLGEFIELVQNRQQNHPRTMFSGRTSSG